MAREARDELRQLFPAMHCFDQQSCRAAVLEVVADWLPILRHTLVLRLQRTLPWRHIYTRYLNRTLQQIAADDADISRQQELIFLRLTQGWGREGPAGVPHHFTAPKTHGMRRSWTRSVTWGHFVCAQAARRILGLHYCVAVLRMQCSYRECPERLVDVAHGGDGRIPSIHYRWYKPISEVVGDPCLPCWSPVSELADAPLQYHMQRFLDGLSISRIVCVHTMVCGSSSIMAWDTHRDAHRL